MTVLTVNKLYHILEELIEQGEKDKLVLIPDFSGVTDTNYRTINRVENDDTAGRCVYLGVNTVKEEKEFWKRIREIDKRAEAKQTEAWEKLKEALKEYLKYDTIVIHKEYPEDTEICAADFQELSLNEEGVISVCD